MIPVIPEGLEPPTYALGTSSHHCRRGSAGSTRLQQRVRRAHLAKPTIAGSLVDREQRGEAQRRDRHRGSRCALRSPRRSTASEEESSVVG